MLGFHRSQYLSQQIVALTEEHVTLEPSDYGPIAIIKYSGFTLMQEDQRRFLDRGEYVLEA
jgi:hypothetical protein